jgi:choline dehydrogenase-like flavoprotein
MATNSHYDVIIIGTGAGGGTLAHALADTGKRILLLERGNWLPREKENWDVREVFINERYHATEMWHDKHGKPFRPHTNYNVGGNTKVYGSILFRFRPSTMRTWPRTTPRPSACMPSTASVAATRLSRPAPTRTRGRR